jgi:hypothetical protein
MFSSRKGKENTSVEERRKLWKDYVTKPSNKIDTSKLPKEFRSIHLLASKASKASKVSKAELVTTRETRKVSGEKTKPKSKTHSEGMEGNRTGIKTAQKVHGGKRKAGDSEDDETHGKNAMNSAKYIDLEVTAKLLWRERYGENMPDIKAFGDSYKNIGTVWTMCVDIQERSVYTTTEYRPSVLDESVVALLAEDGEDEEKTTTVTDKPRFAFSSQKLAKRAFYWWIICTIPTVHGRRKWAKDMLGECTSVVLYTNSSPVWSTLSRGDDGSIWVEYNGRKCALL